MRLYVYFPFLCFNFVWFSLHRPYTCCHSLFEFIYIFLCLEDIISLVHWPLRSLCLLFYIITEPRREGVDKVIILLSAPKPHPLCRLDSCGSLCQLPSATRTFSDEIQWSNWCLGVAFIAVFLYPRASDLSSHRLLGNLTALGMGSTSWSGP